MVEGVIGVSFHIGTKGIGFDENVETLQDHIGSGGAYLIGLMRPVMLKGHREASFGHCDGLLATRDVNSGDTSATAAEEMAPRAAAPTALPQRGLTEAHLRDALTRAPPRAAAQPRRSSPSAESNLFSSYSGGRERNRAWRRRVGLTPSMNAIKEVASASRRTATFAGLSEGPTMRLRDRHCALRGSIAPRGSMLLPPRRSQPSVRAVGTSSPRATPTVGSCFDSYAMRRGRTTAPLIPTRSISWMTVLDCMPPTTATHLPPSAREFEGGADRLGRRNLMPRRASFTHLTAARLGKFEGPPRGLGRSGRIPPSLDAVRT
jgi:hypothetical protein